jgi:hypothetical protein
LAGFRTSRQRSPRNDSPKGANRWIFASPAYI